MIADEHELTDLHVGAEAAGRVGEEEDLDARGAHGAHHRLERDGIVGLVEMLASAQHDHRHTAELADDQLARVPGRGEQRETRELRISEGDRLRDLRRESAQAGAEDNGDFRFSPRQRGRDFDGGQMDVFCVRLGFVHDPTVADILPG